MTSGRRVPPNERRKILRRLRDGYSIADVSRELKYDRQTIAGIRNGARRGDGDGLREARQEADLPMPRKREELSAPALRALDDIEYFALRYFGAILQPWQVECALTVVDLAATEEEEYLVVNAPPGSGKSFFHSTILAAWLTCRDRTIRGMIGSVTEGVAKNYTKRLRNHFQRTMPVKGNPRKMALGLEQDAESTMSADYGFFKPTVSDIWRVEEFTVAREDDTQATEKESTWTAFGPDSGLIGGRFDFIIWDDIWDPRKLRTTESKTAMKEWYSDVAESRLEPAGLMILQGQRLGSDDIYRYALEQDGYLDEELEDEPQERPRRYHHLKFRAHYEDRCEKQHRKSAPAYPDGCLLSPRRVSWGKLESIRRNRGHKFQVVYQQEDTDPENVLVEDAWIKGGTDSTGFDAPGCWDNDRKLWELPKGLVPPIIVIATADPSPTNYWAIECWAYHPASEQRFLLDLVRQKMDAPAFLDWNYNDGRFTGIVEEWQRISEKIGHPIQYWIVESNAAQRFMLQYDHVRRWMALNSVQILAHETHRNKSDDEFGVQTIGPHYQFGRVRLPGYKDARIASFKLVDEVTRYPDVEHDDTVMAHWFLEWRLPYLYNPVVANTRLRRPSWMRRQNRSMVGA